MFVAVVAVVAVPALVALVAVLALPESAPVNVVAYTVVNPLIVERLVAPNVPVVVPIAYVDALNREIGMPLGRSAVESVVNTGADPTVPLPVERKNQLAVVVFAETNAVVFAAD